MTTTLSTLTIRRFRDEDYAVYRALHNAVYTDFAQTEESLRFDDGQRPEKCKHARWVAERDGCAIGYGQYDQFKYVYDPRKFYVEFAVQPGCEQLGVGGALYETVIDALRPFDPVKLDIWGREDMPCRVKFVAKRGFEEKFRVWASELDLRTFDPSRFAHRLDAGVEITTLAQLEDSEETRRKLFDLQLEVRDDIPLSPGEVRQPLTYEEWLEGIDYPTRIDDGYFLAVADGQLVGTSNMWRSPEPDMVRTGLTATRREYRRRGIAFALKVTALRWAKEQGYARTVTDNASINRPMLSINEELGFVKQPAWIHYVADWANASRSSSFILSAAKDLP